MTLPSRVLVVGLARSGRSATAALAKRGVDVVVADAQLGNDDDAVLLEGVGLLVKSPGVPGEHPSSRRRAPGGSRCGARSSSATGCCQSSRFVGVTGTNGKTTTVELLGAMFRAAGAVGRRCRQRRPAA